MNATNSVCGKKNSVKSPQNLCLGRMSYKYEVNIHVGAFPLQGLLSVARTFLLLLISFHTHPHPKMSLFELFAIQYRKVLMF